MKNNSGPAPPSRTRSRLSLPCVALSPISGELHFGWSTRRAPQSKWSAHAHNGQLLVLVNVSLQLNGLSFGGHWRVNLATSSITLYARPRSHTHRIAHQEILVLLGRSKWCRQDLAISVATKFRWTARARAPSLIVYPHYGICPPRL